MDPELQAYEGLLCGHTQGFIYRLRLLPADKWDWTPNKAAPSSRVLAVHAWQWLVCDRQHILEPDALKHPSIPDPPADPSALCDRLAEEMENWRTLIRSLTPEQLSRPILNLTTLNPS